MAGKQAGLGGSRSGLFHEYVRCLKEKRPAHFVWENVKGALSSNGGRDFAVILAEMAEAGYSLWWQVLNAKDFGIPQNRERVFVVGTRSDLGSPREVFFEPADAGEDKGGDEQRSFIDLNYVDARTTDVARCIQARYAKGYSHHKREVSGVLDTLTPPGTPEGFRVYGTDGVAKTLSALAGGMGAKTGLYAVGGGVTNTGGVNVEGRIRRLMPVECEKLMSWPSDWTKYGRKEDGTVYEMSDSARYRMCGNGVVSKVVEAVVAPMLTGRA